VASVSPAGATGQTHGYGLGDYATLFDFGAGLPRFFLNSAIVWVLTVGITLLGSLFRG
jgi:multiple sugar transport system permease protein